MDKGSELKGKAVEGKVVGEKEPVKEAKHPLLEFVPTTFESFEEWLERWNSTTNLAEKLGLLHYCTLEGSCVGGCKLISFLMEIADGHEREGNFTTEYVYSPYDKVIKHRQIIAKKAFSVLCTIFFKDKDGGLRRPPWWWMLNNEEVFQKTLWFLRRDGNRLRNWMFGENHQKDVFYKFLVDFAWLGWEFHGFSDPWNPSLDEPIKKRLIEARPRFIEILYEGGKLHWLNRREVELDDESIKKLVEMAMENEYHFPPSSVSSYEHRKPKSLTEAVLGGSVAAQVVVLYRIKQKERKRLRELREAALRKQKEDNRRRQIANMEAQRKDLDKDLAALKK